MKKEQTIDFYDLAHEIEHYNSEGGYAWRNINGTKTMVYTKYLTGTLDADAQTDVAHSIDDVDKIWRTTVKVWNSVATFYGVYDNRASNLGADQFYLAVSATNVIIGAVGADYQSQKYRIGIEYSI